MRRPFERVLVANRGEIAIRIMRTLREMGIESIAVYSDVDENAPHVRFADHAVNIGPAPAAQSYLNIGRIIEAAKSCRADAVHPGYGFLAERAAFATACAEAGMVFIGPRAEHIALMGDKIRARQTMRKAGMPVVPGSMEPVRNVEEARIMAADLGFPVAIKAAAGGGGKGLRVAAKPEDLQAAFEAACSEGQRFFGDGTCYLERYFADPRHIEVQVVADRHGNVVHLGERDCSIQRRNQKLIEESPAPRLGAQARKSLLEFATGAVRAIGYENAGTIECLAVGDEFYFLEMNTRIQVEHCVTEVITGVDIVALQLAVAAGEALPIKQSDVQFRGHAIECRINAESATKGFLPMPGEISIYREPGGPGVRVDAAAGAGVRITPLYDSMFAKLIVHAPDRQSATRRMLRALSEYRVEGIRTLIPFHLKLLRERQWEQAETCRDLVNNKAWLRSIEE